MKRFDFQPVRPGRAALSTWATIGIGALLAVCYTFAYLGHPQLPGNDPASPLGWWGWFDQSVTLRSTAALARGVYDPSQHHYPLGYALLGVPFYRAMPMHPYFFVDLLSLLGALAGFVSVGRRLGLPGAVAAALFAFGTLGDAFLFRQWVVPWNTTSAGAFTWLLVALVAAWLDGRRRPWWLGVLVGAIAVCRPSDGLVVLPCLAAVLWAERRSWPAWPGLAGRAVAGAAAVAAPVIGLHLAIYGAAESPYMASSAKLGFTLFDLGWKAYVLLIDPYPWFADGKGLLQHAHWIALGLAGIVAALLRGPKERMVAAVLVVHATLYIAYVDLLPTGLWRYLNVHYFAWAVPGYALMAALLLRDLFLAPPPQHPWTRRAAWASLVVTLLVLCLRVVPAPAATDQPAKALDFAGPMPPFLDTYLSGRMALRDANGLLLDNRDIRVFLYPGGMRVIGLRRAILGPVTWLAGQAPEGFEGAVPSARWTPRVQFAWPPRWLRRAAPPGIPVPVS